MFECLYYRLFYFHAFIFCIRVIFVLYVHNDYHDNNDSDTDLIVFI